MQVLIDELISIGIVTKEHYDDPAKALRDIIDWHVDVALDPKVSKSACALKGPALYPGVRYAIIHEGTDAIPFVSRNAERLQRLLDLGLQHGTVKRLYIGADEPRHADDDVDGLVLYQPERWLRNY